MKISIMGLGWFGEALAHQLGEHEVLGTTRTLAKVNELSEKKIKTYLLESLSAPDPILLNVDVIVLNIPPFKEALSWFQSWEIPRHVHLIFISSTSVYGEGEGIHGEASPLLGSSPQAQILINQERWVQSFPHFTILRFGGLLGGRRHPGKYLSGKINLESPHAPVNLIHQNDATEFTKHVINQKIQNDIFNVVYPYHPTRKNFYEKFCRQQGITLPEFSQESTGHYRIISSQKAEKIFDFSHPLEIKS